MTLAIFLKLSTEGEDGGGERGGRTREGIPDSIQALREGMFYLCVVDSVESFLPRTIRLVYNYDLEKYDWDEYVDMKMRCGYEEEEENEAYCI